MGKKTVNKPVKSNKRNDRVTEVIEDKKEELSLINGFSLSIGNDKHTGDYRNININQFSIDTAKKKLFDNTDLQISHGRKYGLIGPNGKGKTTILNHIAKRLLPISKNLDLLLVEQEVAPSSNKVINIVLDANKKKRKLEKEISIIQNIIETEDDFEESIITEMHDMQQELNSIGSEKDESKVRKILYGLGFEEKDQERPTSDFSGGWRMRISIAKALYMEPTLLLLDEPTNHLDLNAVIWLTNYLTEWRKSLIVVSHNQAFLNEVCTDILHISKLKLDHYKGNYAKFSKALVQKKKNEQKAWDKVEKRLNEMRKKGENKNKQKEYIDKTGLNRPEKDYVVNINFGEPNDLTRPVLNINDVSFEYTEGNTILKNVEFGLDLDSRITIVGPNGAGKSTFINLLVGNLDPTTGSVYRNHSLKIAYYNQHFIDVLPMDQTPIEYLQTIDNIPDQDIRRMLGTIGLEGNAHVKQIGTLSGGQKARVVLVSCQMLKPHILVMDEPTNHLDIESINGLIDAINKFEGGVVLVSHDMELITQTECVLWVCNNKVIKKYDGEYDDYRDEILSS